MELSFGQQADPLLSAFDRVANGNSHLLQAPALDRSLSARFVHFARSRAFKRQLCQSDLDRGWANFQRYDQRGELRPRAGGFYNGLPIRFAQSLTAAAFADRLAELLNEGPCWYGNRLQPAQVAQIIDNFLLAFAVDDQVLEAETDFLFSHDYLGRHGGAPGNPRAICYFDGCGADHCFAWLSKGQLLVLLLNGTD